MSDQVIINGGGGSATEPLNGNPQGPAEAGVNGGGVHGNGPEVVGNGQPQTLNLAGIEASTPAADGGEAATAGGTGGDAASLAGDDAATEAGASSIPPSEVGGGRPPLETVGSEGGGPSSLGGGMVGPPSPLTGCYLLIILGEPHSEEHKDNILQHLLKGKCQTL